MYWLIDWCACLAVKGIAACGAVIPRTWGLWCGRRLGDLMYLAKPVRVHVADVNLRWAFGARYTRRERLRLVREAFQTLGQTGVELLQLPRMDCAYVDRYITVRGMAHVEAALQHGRGIVFLTGHIGNWELSSIVSAIKGYPMVVLAREQKLPRLYALLVSYREAKGCRVIGKGMALRAMVRELRANRIVGIVGDQGAKTQGVRVNLFGRDALSPVGPVALALRTGATILPTFIHRTRGPYHTIEVEAPLDVTRGANESHEAIVARGLRAFMDRLEARVTQHPGQWLWMHKRWKSTTRRHALLLNDGKPGHLKQSLAIVEALRTHHPTLTHEVASINFRSRAHRVLVALATWLPWRAGRSVARWALETSDPLFDTPCDYVISCGAATAPLNAVVARDTLAKSIVVMRPSLVPLRRFDLALIPAHDHPRPRPNVVVTQGALTAMTPERLATAREHLLRTQHLASDGRTIGVLWGGDTEDVRWPVHSVEQLLDGLEQLCRSHNAQLFFTTSRRTPSEIEAVCAARLTSQAWCPLLILANRSNVDGAVEGIIGAARILIVSGESTSMISEAVASGRPVVVIVPETTASRNVNPKRQAFLDTLQSAGRIHLTTAARCADAMDWGQTTPSDHMGAPGVTTPDFDLLCQAVERVR